MKKKIKTNISKSLRYFMFAYDIEIRSKKKEFNLYITGLLLFEFYQLQYQK